MNQIFRENLKYILAVLLVWAITFPWILRNRDTILAKLTLTYNSFFGYPNPRIAHQLIAKGDAVLESRKEGGSNVFQNISQFFSAEENTKGTVLPLDLALMEKSCLYFRTKEHVEEHFLELTWREKASEWGSPLFQRMAPQGELLLGPNPKDYWNSHIEAVLTALDYYKRALRFSGPELLAPKKIESVAWASCRPSEILLAYKTHMLETESYVLQKLTELEKVPSGLSAVQKRSVVLSSIKRSDFSEVSANDYLESLLRQILLTGMKQFSPREMDDIYERILYFVGSDEREYLKFKFRRAELYFQLGKEENSYYQKASIEFKESSNIQIASELEDINLPALLVHEFEAKLRQAESLHKLKENNKSLVILDSLKSKLRNVDERSVGGKKDQILKAYHNLNRSVLRKLGRYEEADEIPFNE
ncbi:hypothetical protein [Leptospira jelokensis]|uniref:hypothetical protein n=1 Tax=Leptospira jelokensis TaxID=2484931 RepID=UPI001090B64C|nr:hypothetical protein [Leptospira jelokensis]TGL99127.1 hypothetical protein EHQ79_15015 [Leptospira jelokensis]